MRRRGLQPLHFTIDAGMVWTMVAWQMSKLKSHNGRTGRQYGLGKHLTNIHYGVTTAARGGNMVWDETRRNKTSKTSHNGRTRRQYGLSGTNWYGNVIQNCHNGRTRRQYGLGENFHAKCYAIVTTAARGGNMVWVRQWPRRHRAGVTTAARGGNMVWEKNGKK